MHDANYWLSEGIGFDVVGNQVVLTLRDGDLLVLSESAGVILLAALYGNDPADVISGKYGFPYCESALIASRFIRRLQSLKVIEDAHQVLSSCNSVSRKTFLAGMCAFGFTLLSPESAFGEQSVSVAEKCYNGVALGEWKTSSADRIWFDSLGEEVLIPAEINRIAPYGPFARGLIESLGGYSVSNITARGMHASVFPESIAQASSLYASTGSYSAFSKVAIEAEKPDLILSVGTNYAWLDDGLENSLNDEYDDIPIVHLISGIADIPQAFRTIGELLNTDEAANLADCIAKYYVTFAQGVETLGTLDRKKVYFGQGADGLSTRLAGTAIDEVFELIGLENIAHSLSVEEANQVDPLWIIEQKPDLIIISSPGFASFEESSELIRGIWFSQPFSDLSTVALVPEVPFSWLDGSPLTSATLGALWVANLAYPEIFNYSLPEVVVEYFEKFFHIDTDIYEIEELLHIALNPFK